MSMELPGLLIQMIIIMKNNNPINTTEGQTNEREPYDYICEEYDENVLLSFILSNQYNAETGFYSFAGRGVSQNNLYPNLVLYLIGVF